MWKIAKIFQKGTNSNSKILSILYKTIIQSVLLDMDHNIGCLQNILVTNNVLIGDLALDSLFITGHHAKLVDDKWIHLIPITTMEII